MDLFWGGALVVLAALAYLFLPRRRSVQERERLERATRRVDIELAGNLELLTMFSQTKQSAVLENAGYRDFRDALASASPDVAARLDVLYERMPDAEDAMQRRGPAGTLPPEAVAIVHDWEGEARALQHAVRALAGARPPTPGQRLIARVTRTVRRDQAKD